MNSHQENLISNLKIQKINMENYKNLFFFLQVNAFSILSVMKIRLKIDKCRKEKDVGLETRDSYPIDARALANRDMNQ